MVKTHNYKIQDEPMCSSRVNHKKLYWFSCLILIITVNLVNQWSPDYYAYIAYLTQPIVIEPTFICIRTVINSLLYGEPLFLFLFYSILGISIKFISIPRVTRYVYWSLFIYFCSYWFYHEVIQIRVGVASSILLYSLPYLKEKQFFKYALCVVVATLFHYSAIILICLWLLVLPSAIKIKGIKSISDSIKYPTFIIISIILNILGLDIISILKYIPLELVQNKILAYTQIANDLSARGVLDADTYNPFITWYIFKAVLSLIYWILQFSIKRSNPYFILALKIYTIGVCMLWLLSGAPVIASRLSELLCITQIVFIPMIMSSSLPKPLSTSIIIVIGLAWIHWNMSSFILI